MNEKNSVPIKKRTTEGQINQKIDNIEATQGIVIENQGGIRNLVKRNYDAIIKNRDMMNGRFDTLEKKQDALKDLVLTELNKKRDF